jgi:hypothetical protein
MSHIERMKAAHKELETKIKKINTFIHSNDIFKKLDDLEQARMIKQGERIRVLEATLVHIRELLATKPIDCLGSADDGQTVWPIRDEVIANITKAIESK